MRITENKTTANIDVELSPQQTSQNLIDTSVSSPANDSHGMTINTVMNLTFETQQVQQHQQQQITSGKKETYLLSWFTSSPSTTSASMNNASVVSATSSSSAITASPPTIAPRYNANEFESSQHDDSSSPSMKINNKLSYGEKFISKFNKNGNKATTSSEHQNSDQMTSTAGVSKHEQQQKSSRRTTSLLNLFMSNSQGNIDYIIQKNLKTKNIHASILTLSILFAIHLWIKKLRPYKRLNILFSKS